MVRSLSTRPPATRSRGCARLARRHRSRSPPQPDGGKNQEPENRRSKNREPSCVLGSCFSCAFHCHVWQSTAIIPSVLGFALTERKTKHKKEKYPAAAR